MFSLVFWPSDGTTQSLGSCLRDFRNKPYPIRAKITYYKKTLTVREKRLCSKWRWLPSSRAGHAHGVGLLAQLARSLFCLQVMINNGFTPNKDDYEFCTKMVNMIIPTEGFFGISAATGGLAGTCWVFLTFPYILCLTVISPLFICADQKYLLKAFNDAFCQCLCSSHSSTHIFFKPCYSFLIC